VSNRRRLKAQPTVRLPEGDAGLSDDSPAGQPLQQGDIEPADDGHGPSDLQIRTVGQHDDVSILILLQGGEVAPFLQELDDARQTGAGASSGITLILAQVPLFEVSGRPLTIRWKGR